MQLLPGAFEGYALAQPKPFEQAAAELLLLLLLLLLMHAVGIFCAAWPVRGVEAVPGGCSAGAAEAAAAAVGFGRTVPLRWLNPRVELRKRPLPGSRPATLLGIDIAAAGRFVPACAEAAAAAAGGCC
jgi:hypothetical protein